MVVELDAVVGELVARSGAQAARLVDARTGAVLSSAGSVAGAEVATLVRLAREVAPMAGGGVADLVLTTGDAVHVLRPLPRAFLHLRIDPGGDVSTARRELASPALRRALDRVLVPASIPGPRTPVDGPALAALAALGAPARTPGPGALAVLALGRLPRREAARPPAQPGVLNQSWALDVATMQRLVAGLHRLN